MSRLATWFAVVPLALAGCTVAPGRVYVQTPRNTCDGLAAGDHGRLIDAPADAAALLAQLSWTGSAGYRYRWYGRPDGGRIVCLYHPDDSCSPATRLFKPGVNGWTNVADAGKDVVCTADTRIDP